VLTLPCTLAQADRRRSHVPSDYDQIRAENIARYGWDTVALELLGQLYSDRTHFLFELIQNAEDAGATELTFELLEDRLEVRHDGRAFTEADVRGLCGVGQGTKAEDLLQIGKFGIGFKSVYAYTDNPRIYGADEHFRIEKYVRPHQVDPLGGAAGETVFIFPFDRDEVPPPAAAGEISAALRDLSVETLLFLRSIERVRIGGAEVPPAMLARTSAARERSGRRIVLTSQRGAGRENQEWLLWHRPLDALGQPAQRVEIAFPLRAGIDARALVRRESSPLVVFFPTQKETFVGFLMQGPYRTTPARDNVPEHDQWNQALAGETARLVAGTLAELRDDGLLTVDILQALPLDAARFGPGTLFRPLFDAVRDALAADRLIPAAAGYHRAGEVALVSAPELCELLTPELAGQLCGAPGPVWLVADAVSESRTPLLWRYLREEAGVAELTPAAVVTALSGEFLAARTDEWMGRLYGFLYQHPALWQPPAIPGDEPPAALAQPVIRLEDGSQVTPFDARGRPAAYLPGAAGTEFPVVRRAIAGLPGARQFLLALGYSEPDAVAEILDHVLPRYADADAGALDAAQHDADLELIARTLAEAPPGRQQHLLAGLRSAAFLVGENAATGETRLLRPAELYERSKGLEVYFDGNPQAWFTADRYGPWLPQLRGMGIRQSVQVDARAPGQLGYVVLVEEFARHERGVAGFDPAAAIEGLEYALGHPNAARSEYVWNMLLVPNRHLIAGIVETSHRLEFADAQREEMLSVLGAIAAAAAWLPAADGAFRPPAEVAADDLPRSYLRDDVVARALQMSRPVIDEANQQLGFPPGFLRRLSTRPDLVARIDRELGSPGAGAAGPLA
jgi:hypothetical protein